MLRLRHEELKRNHDQRAQSVQDYLNVVVGNLERLLPGSPDVGALQFAVGRSGQAQFAVPPMLAHSWAILQEFGASVIPAGSYADRIRTALCATRAWLIFDKSKMLPRTGVRPRRRGALASLPPELQEAAKRLQGQLEVKVDESGRIVLRRT